MEENKTYEKRRQITFDEVVQLTDDYGVLKLSDLQAETQVFLKILDEPSFNVKEKGKSLRKGTGHFEMTEEEKTQDPIIEFMFDVAIKKPDGEHANFRIRVGESAYNRFVEKYTNKEEYVGKYCFFTKTKMGKNYPQFINVVDFEPGKKFDKSEIFAVKEKTIRSDVPMALVMTPEDEELVKDFISNYPMLKEHDENNLMRLAFVGAFWNGRHPEQMKPIIEMFDRIIKQ